MGGYGKTALMAVELVLSQEVDDPREAWDIAVKKIFNSEYSWKKGCPKSTFLGLCEEGLIKGISGGNYTNSTKNKSYALKALQILKEKPSLVTDEIALWNEVISGKNKSYNQQMDVVISLWKHEYLRY